MFLLLASATILLTFAPMVFLSLVLLLMLVTMTLVGTHLRRNEYEDYDIRLPNSLSGAPETVNLYRLNGFLKTYEGMKLI